MKGLHMALRIGAAVMVSSAATAISIVLMEKAVEGFHGLQHRLQQRKARKLSEARKAKAGERWAALLEEARRHKEEN